MTTTTTTHYIAMAGLAGGYLPNYCDVSQTREGAVSGLAQIHDLGPNMSAFLDKHGCLSLNPRWGNELLEVVECDCDNPQEHSEEKLDWD